jgi:hypothetical protein
VRSRRDACASPRGNSGQGLEFPMREAGFCEPRGCRNVRRGVAVREPAGSLLALPSKERRSWAFVAPAGGMPLAGFGAKSASHRGPSVGGKRRATVPGARRDPTPAARAHAEPLGAPGFRCAVDKPRPFDSFDSAKMAVIPGGSAFSYRRASECSRTASGATRSRSGGADIQPKSAALRWIRPGGGHPHGGASRQLRIASKVSRTSSCGRCVGLCGTSLAGVETAAFAAPAAGAGRFGRGGHERIRFWGWQAGIRPGCDAEDHSCRWAGLRRERIGA